MGSKMLNELEVRFAQLEREYLPLADQLKKFSGYIAYTDQDLFTLEPFHAEIYNLNTRQMKLVADPEELQGSHIFQIAVADGKPVLHREWLGENCHYDGVFKYEDNKKTRIVVYVKDGKIKPICLEILERNDDGSFKKYQSINQYGLQEFKYRDENFIIYIDAFNITEDSIRTKLYSLVVNLSKKDYSISSIYRIDNNGDHRIFDAAIKDLSLEELLDQALKSKSDDIIRASHAPELVDKKIHCLLIEYSSQNPLHSSLAFIQQHETELKENDHPLTWLNAPDAELFFDDVSAHDSLYARINRLFDIMQDQEFARSDEMEVEESEEMVYAPEESELDDNELTADIPEKSQQLIKEFYIKLAKSLKLKLRKNTSFQLADDFYVCPRDFESCNEVSYLQAILPRKQFNKIRKAIENYEKSQAEHFANDPLSIKMAEMKSTADNLIPELIQIAENTPPDYWYSDERFYFIEPFGLEQKTGKTVECWRDLLSREIPSSSFYFRYQINDGIPVSMAEISDDRPVRQWYWKRDDTQIFEIEYYCFRGPPHVESCSLLEFTNNQAYCYTEYCLTYEHTKYKHDNTGKIIQSHWLRAFPGHAGETHGIDIFYEYLDGKISKIYRNPDPWDDDERFCIYFP